MRVKVTPSQLDIDPVLVRRAAVTCPKRNCTFVALPFNAGREEEVELPRDVRELLDEANKFLGETASTFIEKHVKETIDELKEMVKYVD